MKLTEERLEQAIIELLQNQGFPDFHGDSIARSAAHEVLIQADLKSFLAQRYQADAITTLEIESIVRQLETLPAADLSDNNKTFMK